jgi:hypothetical protein
MNMKSRVKSLRNKRAGAILELGLIASLLVVITLFCTDVVVLMLGSGVNERACRDAARMAAEGTTYNQALVLAQVATKAYQGDGYFVTTPVVDVASFVYNDYSGSPPADTSPYVRVSTSCQIRLPAPIFLYGLNFNPPNMRFTKTYTFPIVTTAMPIIPQGP